MEISPEAFNGLAGIAALVTNILMIPTIRALRRIANDHSHRLTRVEEQVDDLKEAPRAHRSARNRRPR